MFCYKLCIFIFAQVKIMETIQAKYWWWHLTSFQGEEPNAIV